jgi:xanthine phosphoribosyltransferase
VSLPAAPDYRPFGPLVARIVNEATVENDRILKIDHFLNHRIEPELMRAMGAALAERIAPFQPDLVLTAEASGIAPALVTALALDLPVVYAKKYAPVVEPPALSRIVPSPTKGGETRLVVAARYLPRVWRWWTTSSPMAKPPSPSPRSSPKPERRWSWRAF